MLRRYFWDLPFFMSTVPTVLLANKLAKARDVPNFVNANAMVSWMQ